MWTSALIIFVLGLWHVQVSREELQAAMGFLSDQLGEEELRALLERLNAWGDASQEPIPVAKLMALAHTAQHSVAKENGKN